MSIVTVNGRPCDCQGSVWGPEMMAAWIRVGATEKQMDMEPGGGKLIGLVCAGWERGSSFPGGPSAVPVISTLEGPVPCAPADRPSTPSCRNQGQRQPPAASRCSSGLGAGPACAAESSSLGCECLINCCPSNWPAFGHPRDPRWVDKPFPFSEWTQRLCGRWQVQGSWAGFRAPRASLAGCWCRPRPGHLSLARLAPFSQLRPIAWP